MSKKRRAEAEERQADVKPSRFFRRPVNEIPDIPIVPTPEYRKIPLPPEPEPGFYDSLVQQGFDLSAARVLVEQEDSGTRLQILGEMEKDNPILRVEISQNGVTRFKLVSADNAVLLCENLGIFLADYVKK